MGTHTNHDNTSGGVVADLELTTRLAAAVLAQHLAAAVNPDLTIQGAPVARALLIPAAQAAVVAMADAGYRLVKTRPEVPQEQIKPDLTLHQGGRDCHNGPCRCAKRTSAAA